MKKYEQYPLHIQNSLSREKEKFEAINPPHVGLYVCGPTVYSDVHLGNCRTFVSFDVIYRYLTHLDYQVRYVRNITDVGHLLDDGEDRMAKRAKVEQLEPMEVAQKYTNGFRKVMQIFNTLPPSIEPQASGHIPEQIEMVQSIIDNGYGYEKNGSVYFNTRKFAQDQSVYGQLSGRILEDLLVETRDLKNQDEKLDPADFAIWMKADERHIMRWNSPWSVGFPGWHLECSAMSTKYLGKTFDIHGGGADLKFPHHENEIAQNHGACGCSPAKYWMHANMLLLNGKKMSKSDGNTITPEQLFSGDSEHISKGYDPMTVRFFFLQAHYSSTLDISDSALQAAEKGYKRLINALPLAENLKKDSTPEKTIDPTLNERISTLVEQCYSEMSNDFNTAKTLAVLFEISSLLNEMDQSPKLLSKISLEQRQKLATTYLSFVEDVLGLKKAQENTDTKIQDVMEILIQLRQEARANKNWALSDQIRDQLLAAGITLKDGKDGTTFTF